jgi:hypothetical protein
MAVQAFRNLIQRGELWGVAALVIIGVSLIVLAPGNADPDIPILKEAKAEYAKLQ